MEVLCSLFAMKVRTNFLILSISCKFLSMKASEYDIFCTVSASLVRSEINKLENNSFFIVLIFQKEITTKINKILENLKITLFNFSDVILCASKFFSRIYVNSLNSSSLYNSSSKFPISVFLIFNFTDLLTIFISFAYFQLLKFYI